MSRLLQRALNEFHKVINSGSQWCKTSRKALSAIISVSKNSSVHTHLGSQSNKVLYSIMLHVLQPTTESLICAHVHNFTTTCLGTGTEGS